MESPLLRLEGDGGAGMGYLIFGLFAFMAIVFFTTPDSQYSKAGGAVAKWSLFVSQVGWTAIVAFMIWKFAWRDELYADGFCPKRMSFRHWRERGFKRKVLWKDLVGFEEEKSEFGRPLLFARLEDGERYEVPHPAGSRGEEKLFGLKIQQLWSGKPGDDAVTDGTAGADSGPVQDALRRIAGE